MTSKQKGVVAAGHEVTANAAAEMLAEGGNAFDAVLAGLFAACVPEVVLASLGGGGTLMAHKANTGQTTVYDFFVDTPAIKRPPDETDFRSVLVDFGPASQEFHVGIGATAVPGFVPGVFAIHKDLCTLPMKRIIEPAVRAARDGVVMNAFNAYLFSIVEPILTKPAKEAIFSSPEGKLLKEGETQYNHALANTLEALAEEGPDLFVDGEIGKVIQRHARENGGHLTRDDLNNYRVERRRPLTHTYRGHEFFLNPAPAASGPLIAFGFALLEALESDNIASPALLASVMAATNDVRRENTTSLGRITNRDVIAQHIKAVRNHAPSPRGTTHISVIDAAGNAASATVSNGEGNGIKLGDYGFMLNNMLGEEDLNPHGYNTWEPGTRMSTMMAPTVIRGTDGTLTTMGSGGSNRIRSAILQVALNLIDRNMAPEDAIAFPRLHVEKCGTLSFEDHFPKQARAELLSAFPDAHAWPDRNMFFGGVHTARRKSDGTLQGAGDARRAGVARMVNN